MPKRLSDITHAYEQTAETLEVAQELLTQAVEAARFKVEAAAHAHRTVADELLAYLRAHPNEAVVANDHAYHLGERHEIVRRPIFSAHHVWVEDAEPEPTYRVPPRDNGTAERVLAKAWDLGSEVSEEAAS